MNSKQRADARTRQQGLAPDMGQSYLPVLRSVANCKTLYQTTSSTRPTVDILERNGYVVYIDHPEEPGFQLTNAGREFLGKIEGGAK
jgi:hypothetical protein